MPEAGRAGTVRAHEKPDFGGPQRTKGGVYGRQDMAQEECNGHIART